MARKAIRHDQIVKLIVGAGKASPSPPVGPALGSKGVKSMDFCKEFNARTEHYVPGIPIPARVTVRPDRSFHFELRTPPTATLLLAAANVGENTEQLRGAGRPVGPRAAAAAAAAAHELAADDGRILDPSTVGAAGDAGEPGNSGLTRVGRVSLKHVYEIAKIKQTETRLSGMSLQGLVKTIIGQAGSMGVEVVP